VQYFTIACLAMTMVACRSIAVNHKVNNMSSIEKDGVSLTLTGPDALPLAVANRMGSEYNMERCLFQLAVKNVSDTVKNMPYDELKGGTIQVYRRIQDKKEIIDNRTKPPKKKGIVDRFLPGEEKSHSVLFEYQPAIAKYEHNIAKIQFCVKWDAGWLRASSYDSGAVDWNESFELCREIRIIDE